MIRSDLVAEWKACGVLRQSDVDGLTAAGVPILALTGDAYGGGFCVMRDRIVPHHGARRFEFVRHDEMAGEGVSALIVLALDAYGDPIDLVSFRNGPAPFIGSWLGRVGLLGEESLWRTRALLAVHATPLDWLRAERRGVCVVDPVCTSSTLRDAGRWRSGARRSAAGLPTC